MALSLVLAACGGGGEAGISETAQAQVQAQAADEKAQTVLGDVEEKAPWPLYRVQALRTRAGGPSAPVSLNNRGQVVGFEHPAPDDGTETPILFGTRHRPARDLNALAGRAVVPRAIDSRGQVLDAGLLLLDTQAGTVRDLSLLPGQLPGTAMGMNDRAQVVGYTHGGSFTSARAALFASEAQEGRELPALPGADGSLALAVNNRGQIVGWSAFDFWQRWRATLFNAAGGPARDLGVLPSGFESLVLNLNNVGQAVGFSVFLVPRPGPVCLAAVRRATLFRLYGAAPLAMDTLSTEKRPCIEVSQAQAINNQGQAVGFAGNVETATRPRTELGWLWQRGVMRKLDDLLVPGSGWRIVDALDINEAGQIAAVGVEAATGLKRAVLLTPVR